MVVSGFVRLINAITNNMHCKIPNKTFVAIAKMVNVFVLVFTFATSSVLDLV